MKIPTPHWLLAAFALALKRVQVGRSQKSLLPTGLRGVGKTVLLNRFVDEAKALGYVVAQIEAAESETLIETLAGEIRRALFELSAKAKIKTAVSKALGVLKSFTLTFGMTDLSIRLGVDPQVGVGDSGVLSSDLTALFVAVGEAAREEKTAVLVAIDELQYLSEDQLASIIVAVHRVTQLALPLLVVGTGLPRLRRLPATLNHMLSDYLNFRMLRRFHVPKHLKQSAYRRRTEAWTLRSRRSKGCLK